MSKEMKYSWNYRFSWVVEFVRKDAEINLDIDGERSQFVIQAGCGTRDKAEEVSIDFCEKLDQKIKALVKQELSGLKRAKE